MDDQRSWFHPSITAIQADQLLMNEGKPGSFLVRYSQSKQDSFSLSVRLADSVTHIKINNDGDCYDLIGGETFATLSELIRWYMEGGGGHGALKEKEGKLIELKYPLPTSDHSTERFFHHDTTAAEADKVLQDAGSPPGTFLVRKSQSQAENFVLSIKTGHPETAVLHVIIFYKDGKFDIADGNKFRSLTELINNYRTHTITDRSGIEITLKQAVDMTHFRASDIEFRVAQLDKEFTTGGGVRRNGFWEEFEHLQGQENSFPRSHGEKPENKRKNRFKNILPYDHTRVILNDGNPKEAESDYINANYLQVSDTSMPESRRKYIACQGCLQHTIADFWRLVIQEKCSVIVMITKIVEDGKNKCVQYWPDDDERIKTFEIYQGSITVTLNDVVSNSDFVKRKLTVEKKIDKGKAKSKEPVSLVVHHYQFQEWRDKKIPTPERTDSILAFINDINEQWKATKYAGPLVVHCSAGIGRTGTLVVIDAVLNQIKNQGVDCSIDIAKLIKNLRSQRSGLVQTDMQYKFIYMAIKRYIDSMRSAPCAKQTTGEYENVKVQPKPSAPAGRVGGLSGPRSPPPISGKPVSQTRNMAAADIQGSLSQAAAAKALNAKRSNEGTAGGSKPVVEQQGALYENLEAAMKPKPLSAGTVKGKTSR